MLEQALFDTKIPLAIAEECILQREKRTGIEQVHDNPEESLCKVKRTSIKQVLRQPDRSL